MKLPFNKKIEKKSIAKIAAEMILDGNTVKIEDFSQKIYGISNRVNDQRTASIFSNIRKRVEILTNQYLIFDRDLRAYRLVKRGDDSRALVEIESRKKSVVYQMDKFIRGITVIMETHPELGPVVAEKASFILHEATRPELRLKAK